MPQAVDEDSARMELSVEQTLALAYVPPGARADVAALWRLDTRLHRIFAFTREPALAEIKLAWWEERLRALRDGVVPLEPLLRQLAAASSIEAADLACIADGWRALLAGESTQAVLTVHARSRGRGLVRAGAAVLGREAAVPMLLAGEGHALVDLAATRILPKERDRTLAAARDRFHQAGRVIWPRPLRPMGMLVELARGDAERGRIGRVGSPGRVARMTWHALTGR